MNTVTSENKLASICPINFKEFDKLNQQTSDLEASILFAKLKFHHNGTKIEKYGNKWIIRSREAMASWFSMGIKKTDRLLSHLESLGLIEKRISLFYGKRMLFIRPTSNCSQIPVNLNILDNIISFTGSLKSALIFSKIAFSLANTKIKHNDIMWSCLKKQELSSWSGLSIRTIYNITEKLQKKGLILKRNFIWNEKSQSHYHIPISTLLALKKNIKQATATKAKIVSQAKTTRKAKSHFCPQLSAKMAVPIRIRTNLKKTNNNTVAELSTKTVGNSGDINFEKIESKLSPRQERYLLGALQNTIARKKLKVAAPTELFEELKFALLNSEQRRGIDKFTHAISRFMKIIADGNWRTPIGFANHSTYGKSLQQARTQQLLQWEKTKQQERESAKNYSKLMGIDMQNNALTTEAMEIVQKMQHIAHQSCRLTNVDKAAAIELLSNKLHCLVADGANREKIISLLKGQQSIGQEAMKSKVAQQHKKYANTIA